MFYFLGDIICRPQVHQNVTSQPLGNYSVDISRTTSSGDRIELFVREHPQREEDYVDSSDVRYAAATRVVYDYGLPSLVVFGLLSNVLACFVLCSKSSRDRLKDDDSGDTTTGDRKSVRSSNVYVVARAVSDALFLVVLLAVWLEMADVARLWTRGGLCQAVTYVSSVASFLSVWFTVAWSIDRTLTAFHRCGFNSRPTVASGNIDDYGTITSGLRSRSTGDVCRPRRSDGHGRGRGAASSVTSPGGRSRARIVVLGLLFLAIPIFLNISLLADVVYVDSRPVCATLQEYRQTTRILDHLHIVVNVTIPLAVITIASVATLILLSRSSISTHNQRRVTFRHSNDENVTVATPPTSTNLEQTPAVVDTTVGDRNEYFRSSCVAQIVSAAVFLLFSIPAHLHQMALPTRFNDGAMHVFGNVDDVASISLESYTTQRLLLVGWYARHGTVFIVHFVVDALFRSRCGALFGRALRVLTSRMTLHMCGRHRVVCCGRNSSPTFDGKTVVIDGSSMQVIGKPVAV